MMRIKHHLTVIIIVIALVLISLALRTAHANASGQVASQSAVIAEIKPPSLPETLNAVQSVPTTTPDTSLTIKESNVKVLDRPRQYALGMIETGNNDRAVGGAGEVSRYQIMPSVWKHYDESRSYRDPTMSLKVAQEHWAALYDYFKKKTQREPTDFDMYVLWNTRQGYYARRGFNPARLHPAVRDGAQRFCNLVERGMGQEAEILADKRA